jgi:5-methylcytosine-specific restriction endonuclease McrA
MREIQEWIASNDDQSIPARVRVRTFDKYNGRCAVCTLPIVGRLRPAYDHIIALINGGQHREANLQLLCVPCHALKTRADVADKSNMYRKRLKAQGHKKPRTMTRWRRFDGSIREAGRER